LFTVVLTKPIKLAWSKIESFWGNLKKFFTQSETLSEFAVKLAWFVVMCAWAFLYILPEQINIYNFRKSCADTKFGQQPCDAQH
jgi:hypothetical protein